MNSILVLLVIIGIVYIALSKHKRLCLTLSVILVVALIYRILQFVGGAL
jgi:hypothetical protein